MAELIRILCPQCGQPASVPAEAVGHQRQCLRCGKRFQAAAVAETITFHCACGRQFIVPVQHAGKRGQCPDCKQPVLVPSPESVPAASATSTAAATGVDTSQDLPETPETASRKPLLVGAALVAVIALVGVAFLLGRSKGPKPTAHVAPLAQRVEPATPETPAKAPVARKGAPAEKTPAAVPQPASKPAPAAATSAPAPREATPTPKAAVVSIAPPATEPAQPAAPPPPNGPIAVVRQLESSGSRFTDLALSRNGHWLASASGSELIIWEMPDGTIVQRFRNSTPISDLDFTADAAYVALAELPGSVAFWNRSTQAITRGQQVHSSTPVVCCAPAGLDVFTCGYGTNLALWRIPNPTPLSSPKVPGGSAYAMTISLDGKQLLFGGAGGLVQLWDIAGKQTVRALRHPDTEAVALALSPDGKRALTGGATFTRVTGSPTSTGEMGMVLWDLDTAQELRRFSGHRDPVNAVAFTPDGHRAVSACGTRAGTRPNETGQDNNVRLWDLDEGKELARFDCGAPVRDMVLSTDGRTVICTGPDGILWVLSLDGDAASGTLASADIPDLLTISKRLTGELSALMTAGKYDEAIAVIDASERDLRRFAGSVHLRLWDNSVAPLFRSAEMKRGQIARKRAKDPASQPADSDTPAQYATRLSATQQKSLANLRTALTRAGALIQENKTTQAKSMVYKIKNELSAFVQTSRVPEWHMSVSPLFQTAARLETTIDGKLDEAPAQAVAAGPAVAPSPSISNGTRYLPVGQTAPAFAGMTLDGRGFSTNQLRGKWVLLDFWSTGCGPCKQEMSTNLKDVFDTFGTDKRFAMISVSIDHQVEDPANYIRQNGVKWGQVWVGQSFSSPVLRAYNVNAIPAIFLIAPDGKVAASGIRGANIKTAVAAALGKK
jgi:WD40 repeat protein/thiol-disulfide isomerase/thioredoxin